jgi:hypothetical protein
VKPAFWTSDATQLLPAGTVTGELTPLPVTDTVNGEPTTPWQKIPKVNVTCASAADATFVTVNVPVLDPPTAVWVKVTVWDCPAITGPYAWLGWTVNPAICTSDATQLLPAGTLTGDETPLPVTVTVNGEPTTPWQKTPQVNAVVCAAAGATLVTVNVPVVGAVPV